MMGDERGTGVAVIVSVSVFAVCFACFMTTMQCRMRRPERRLQDEAALEVEGMLVVMVRKKAQASEGPPGECCVCLEEGQRPMVAEGWFGGCGHEAEVCVECAERLGQRCPLCRRTAWACDTPRPLLPGVGLGGARPDAARPLLFAGDGGAQAHGEAGDAEGVEHPGVAGVPAEAQADVVVGGEPVGVAVGEVGAVAHEQADDADGALLDGVDERGAKMIVEGVDVGLEPDEGGDGGLNSGGVPGGGGHEGAAVEPVEAYVAVDDAVERGLPGLVGLVRG